ncbi:MAG: hypothetical protein C7N36_07810 [Bacteroidetes bacterium]|nr:MAG: hypothetical protein C7N36_07810 [Bacteroidota bacterium]
MINLSLTLAKAVCQQIETEEIVDPFAPAMLTTRENLVKQAASAIVLTRKEPTGWRAELWVKPETAGVVGQRLTVVKHCRTEKLAHITANYFRLHSSINQANTRPDSLSSNTR